MSYPTKSTINHILQSGDVIIMKDETANPTHASIASTHTSSANDYNNIGMLITQLKSSNAANHLYNPQRNRHWVADAYRYIGDQHANDKVNKIRRLIGNQALIWKNIGHNDKQEKIKYHCEAFNEDLICESQKQNILYDHNDDLNTLNYVKYALRKNVSVSKRGITCYGFVMMCIGSGLLDDLLSSYQINKGYKLWPSLKHTNKCGESHALPVYKDVVHMIYKNDKNKIPYDESKFVDLLIEKYESKTQNIKWYGVLMIVFCGLLISIFYDQKTIATVMFLIGLGAVIMMKKSNGDIRKKWEGYIKKEDKQQEIHDDCETKSCKIPLCCYLSHHKQVDEKQIYGKAKEKLGGLAKIHPKYSNIYDLVNYLDNSIVWKKIATNIR